VLIPVASVVLLVGIAWVLFRHFTHGWFDPADPIQIADNLYYVGSKDLASFLVTTPKGNILINTGLECTVSLIQANVAKLDQEFKDIKIILISHAHIDHCAGSAAIKALTGAEYMVMDADVPVVESGGKSDFQYGNIGWLHFPPTKVDRVLHDLDEVSLGGTVLVAHLTPGHTKGCTTWTMKAREGGTTRNVVIVGSPNVNFGYRLVNNRCYPQIARDFQRTFRVLRSLPCDIFLGAHGGFFDLETKRSRGDPDSQRRAFRDHDGYVKFLAEREQALFLTLANQETAP